MNKHLKLAVREFIMLVIMTVISLWLGFETTSIWAMFPFIACLAMSVKCFTGCLHAFIEYIEDRFIIIHRDELEPAE